MWVYVYYVDGLLIDTGQSGARKHVLEEVKKLSVEQIFLTHHHEDHSGNLEPLAAHFKCPVYGSSACAQLMEDPPRISFAQRMVWGDRPANKNIIPVTGKINTRQFQFELIPIPGHAKDMLALYEPNKGWLFSADLFVNDYISYFLYSESMLQQIHSLKKVLTLDFEVMFCCHNPVLKNPKSRLQNKLDFLEDFYGRIAAIYDGEMTAKAVFRALNLKENWQIQLLSQGHLSKLNMVRAAIRDINQQH